jgi:MFS family permease
MPVLTGTIFIFIGNAVTALSAGSSVTGIAIGMGLYGMGFAMIQTPCVSAVSQIVPKNQVGVSTGMFMLIFFVGGGMGVAISVALVEMQAPDALSWIGLSAGVGARYSNAMLALSLLALTAFALIPALPSRDSMNEVQN